MRVLGGRSRYNCMPRNRREFAITDNELKLMTAAAITGLNSTHRKTDTEHWPQWVFPPHCRQKPKTSSA
jgi:hypothetical protein